MQYIYIKMRKFSKKKKPLNIEKVILKNIKNEDIFQCFQDMKPHKRIL